MQPRKTLLFNNSKPWVKKTGNENFDVPMGCYDGAEVCELVGTYILNKLKNITNKENIGLYLDDGLRIFQNIPNTEIERKKKEIVKVFKDCGLSITIKCNLKSVVVPVVTFDLLNHIHKPHSKPNNKPLYINKHSNHPPNILKQLPKSIEKRISEPSSNNDVFNRSIKIYNGALHESNFKETLKFVIPAPKNNDENQKRKRIRDMIWFNPPYSKNVGNGIGKTFLQLLSKHFPKDHEMHKIFNNSTL